jgi:DNA helicase-2/ATP-dependent DNA helicase PcrA
MTRAKIRLYLTAASERRTFGRSYESQISRFISEIPSEVLYTFSEKNSSSNSNYLQTMNYIKNPNATKFSNNAPPKRESKTISIANHRNTAKSKSSVNWKVGDQVTHKKWGVGTVMAVEGANLTINFVNPEIGEKNLNAAIAPITKV